jgi:DNA-binding transcriptional ArsR family regulator
VEDIRSILSQYKSRQKDEGSTAAGKEIPAETPTLSEIPDLFFDEIVPHTKLTRNEIALLMLLYRQIWCRPNLYRGHGIGPLNAYHDLARALNMQQDDVIHAIRALEGQGLIATIRAGQYFVRKFFTENNDIKYGQHYEF